MKRHWIRTAIVMPLSVLLLIAAALHAQRTEPTPKALEEVGVEEHLDVALPLELPFVDSNGEKVRLGDFFDGETPVIDLPNADAKKAWQGTFDW